MQSDIRPVVQNPRICRYCLNRKTLHKIPEHIYEPGDPKYACTDCMRNISLLASILTANHEYVKNGK